MHLLGQIDVDQVFSLDLVISVKVVCFLSFSDFVDKIWVCIEKSFVYQTKIPVVSFGLIPETFEECLPNVVFVALVLLTPKLSGFVFH